MEPEQTVQVESVKPMSAITGVLKVLFQPREVFNCLKVQSNWILPFIIVLIVIGVVIYLRFPLDLLDLPERLGKIPGLSEEQKAMIIEQAPNGIVRSVALGSVFGMLFLFVVAAVYFFVANIFLGGVGKFSKMLSIVGLSWMVILPQYLVKLPPMLAKKTIEIQTDLSLFLSSSLEDSFLYNLFSQIDVFSFWKVFLIGTGMAIVYNFTFRKALVSSLAVWGIFILVISMFSSFIKLGMG